MSNDSLSDAPPRAANDDAPAHRPYEDFVPLQRSKLWDLQIAYYQAIGAKAWSDDIVPRWVTTNPFLADVYARQIVAFVQDLIAAERFNRSQPLTVIELGTGSGHYAFLLHNALRQALQIDGLADIAIRYVATDIAGANLDFMAAHPQLAPLIDRGVLDLAIFDAENDTALALRHAGTTLDADTLENPPVVIANYLFCSLRADYYHFGDDGALSACDVALHGPDPDVEPGHPDSLRDVQLRHRLRVIDNPDQPIVEGDETADQVLRSYVAEAADDHAGADLRGRYVHLPTATFRCLRALAALGDGCYLLLAGDKADLAPRVFLQEAPLLARHGSTSITLNLDAVGRYVHARGGVAWLAPAPSRHLGVATLVEGVDAGRLAHLRRAFHNNVHSFGPEDYYRMRKFMMRIKDEVDFSTFYGFLRMGRWDEQTFQLFYNRIMALMNDGGIGADNERLLRESIPRVEANAFQIGAPAYFLPFCFGMLLQRMRFPHLAIHYFRLADARGADDAGVLFNMGSCYGMLNRLTEARVCYQRALALNPDNAQAAQMIATIDRVLQERGGDGGEG